MYWGYINLEGSLGFGLVEIVWVKLGDDGERLKVDPTARAAVCGLNKREVEVQLLRAHARLSEAAKAVSMPEFALPRMPFRPLVSYENVNVLGTEVATLPCVELTEKFSVKLGCVRVHKRRLVQRMSIGTVFLLIDCFPKALLN